MSTVKVTNLQHASSASPNIVLDSSGNATMAGSMAMATPFAMKNKIINGAMEIDQRNAGASVTVGSGNFFSVDRWYGAATTASKFTLQQNAGSVTPPVGFNYYMGATSTSAYSISGNEAFSIQQIIEGFNVQDLAWGTASAKPATLSFWVRSSLTGTFGGSLATTKTAIWVLPFSYTISSANTWTYITVSIPAGTSSATNTDNTAGVYVRFGLGATGTAAGGTAGVWTSAGNYTAPSGSVSLVGTNGATWYITGVQLEVGTVATPFERRLYPQELVMCKRYYDKTFPINTAPAQNAGRAGALETLAVRTTGATVSSYFRFSQPMRTSPTMTFYNPQAANAQARNLDTASDCTGTSTDNINEIGGKAFYSLPGGAASTNLVSVHWSADAEL